MAKYTQLLSLYAESIKTPVLRNKILFTLGLLLAFRFIAHIPVPGVNLDLLKEFFAQNQILSLLNIFSGGTLANFSIAALGLQPYIQASVIIQLFALVNPRLDELRKEGEYGRQKMNQYMRILTVPIAFVQAFVMYSLLRSQNIITSLSPITIIALLCSMVAGTMIMLFFAELINNYGLGNGTSMLIFAGIVASIPASVLQTVTVADFSNPQTLANFIAFLLVICVLIAGVVFVEEAVLRVPIHYANRGQKTYMPVKIDTAGVMPIIFAVSLATSPSLLGQYLAQTTNPQLIQVGQTLSRLFATTHPLYIIFYFSLVVAFTFFYTQVVFKPKEVSEELRKSGGFIPGVRPGIATEHRLQYITNRLMLVGGIFLGLIAVLPTLAQIATGITTLTVGGTSVLIGVSVIIELTKRIENVVQMYRYERLSY